MEAGISTLLQVVVPNRQLGRVGGGLTTVVEAATLVSMSLAGVLGAALGIPMLFVIGGAICVAMGVAAWSLLPAITLKDKVEEGEPPGTTEEPAPAAAPHPSLMQFGGAEDNLVETR
jgi:predicted MFS family arabinose efflux permease